MKEDNLQIILIICLFKFMIEYTVITNIIKEITSIDGYKW